MKNQKYVSERITNISELTQLIQSSKVDCMKIRLECEKEKPSIESIKSLSFELDKKLEKAVTFDFLIERRTTVDVN